VLPESWNASTLHQGLICLDDSTGKIDCSFCDFQTFYRDQLLRHLRSAHRPPSSLIPAAHSPPPETDENDNVDDVIGSDVIVRGKTAYRYGGPRVRISHFKRQTKKKENRMKNKDVEPVHMMSSNEAENDDCPVHAMSPMETENEDGPAHLSSNEAENDDYPVHVASSIETEEEDNGPAHLSSIENDGEPVHPTEKEKLELNSTLTSGEGEVDLPARTFWTLTEEGEATTKADAGEEEEAKLGYKVPDPVFKDKVCLFCGYTNFSESAMRRHLLNRHEFISTSSSSRPTPVKKPKAKETTSDKKEVKAANGKKGQKAKGTKGKKGQKKKPDKKAAAEKKAMALDLSRIILSPALSDDERDYEGHGDLSSAAAMATSTTLDYQLPPTDNFQQQPDFRSAKKAAKLTTDSRHHDFEGHDDNDLSSAAKAAATAAVTTLDYQPPTDDDETNFEDNFQEQPVSKKAKWTIIPDDDDDDDDLDPKVIAEVLQNGDHGAKVEKALAEVLDHGWVVNCDGGGSYQTMKNGSGSTTMVNSGGGGENDGMDWQVSSAQGEWPVSSGHETSAGFSRKSDLQQLLNSEKAQEHATAGGNSAGTNGSLAGTSGISPAGTGGISAETNGNSAGSGEFNRVFAETNGISCAINLFSASAAAAEVTGGNFWDGIEGGWTPTSLPVSPPKTPFPSISPSLPPPPLPSTSPAPPSPPPPLPSTSPTAAPSPQLPLPPTSPAADPPSSSPGTLESDFAAAVEFVTEQLSQDGVSDGVMSEPTPPTAINRKQKSFKKTFTCPFCGDRRKPMSVGKIRSHISRHYKHHFVQESALSLTFADGDKYLVCSECLTLVHQQQQHNNKQRQGQLQGQLQPLQEKQTELQTVEGRGQNQADAKGQQEQTEGHVEAEAQGQEDTRGQEDAQGHWQTEAQTQERNVEVKGQTPTDFQGQGQTEGHRQTERNVEAKGQTPTDTSHCHEGPTNDAAKGQNDVQGQIGEEESKKPVAVFVTKSRKRLARHLGVEHNLLDEAMLTCGEIGESESGNESKSGGFRSRLRLVTRIRRQINWDDPLLAETWEATRLFQGRKNKNQRPLNKRLLKAKVSLKRWTKKKIVKATRRIRFPSKKAAINKAKAKKKQGVGQIPLATVRLSTMLVTSLVKTQASIARASSLVTSSAFPPPPVVCASSSSSGDSGYVTSSESTQNGYVTSSESTQSGYVTSSESSQNGAAAMVNGGSCSPVTSSESSQTGAVMNGGDSGPMTSSSSPVMTSSASPSSAQESLELVNTATAHPVEIRAEESRQGGALAAEPAEIESKPVGPSESEEPAEVESKPVEPSESKEPAEVESKPVESSESKQPFALKPVQQQQQPTTPQPVPTTISSSQSFAWQPLQPASAPPTHLTSYSFALLSLPASASSSTSGGGHGRSMAISDRVSRIAWRPDFEDCAITDHQIFQPDPAREQQQQQQHITLPFSQW